MAEAEDGAEDAEQAQWRTDGSGGRAASTSGSIYTDASGAPTAASAPSSAAPTTADATETPSTSTTQASIGAHPPPHLGHTPASAHLPVTDGPSLSAQPSASDHARQTEQRLVQPGHQQQQQGGSLKFLGIIENALPPFPASAGPHSVSVNGSRPPAHAAAARSAGNADRGAPDHRLPHPTPPSHVDFASSHAHTAPAGSSASQASTTPSTAAGAGLSGAEAADTAQSGKMPPQLPPNYDPTLPVCSNCTTQTTPLWRRDESGSVLCNACALFQKMKGRPRPMSLKTDVIKQRNRVRKDRVNEDDPDASSVKSKSLKGKSKATQAPALKPHLAAASSGIEAPGHWGGSGTAADRGTSRSRDPLRNARKSAPGGADEASLVAEGTDGVIVGMEVDELEDDDGEGSSYNAVGHHPASLSPESSAGEGELGLTKRRRRRESEDVGDGAGGVPRAPSVSRHAGTRRLSSVNRHGSRSTSRARPQHARAGSLDRIPPYANAPPPGYAYPYTVSGSSAGPPAGARWMMPPGASPYNPYYPLPPPGGAPLPPPMGYPQGYAAYSVWPPITHEPQAVYPVAPPPSAFGTSALRVSSSVDHHLGNAGGAPILPHHHSVRFAPSSAASGAPSSHPGMKPSPTSADDSSDSYRVSPPPSAAMRSASVGRPAGLRVGLAGEEEERGRARGRVTLPPLRAMIGESGEDGVAESGSIVPRSGPPESFEASAIFARQDASEKRAIEGGTSPQPLQRGPRAASVVSSASSDSASRGRPSVASTAPYSPVQLPTHAATLQQRRDPPRFPSNGFGSIEEEPRMLIDDDERCDRAGASGEWSASRRGRSETRKDTLSRGPSGGSGHSGSVGGSGDHIPAVRGVANGSPSPSSRYPPHSGIPAPSFAAFASGATFGGRSSSPNRVAQLSGRPSLPQARQSSGVSNDPEELAHLRTRVAELEIINGLMESRIGQLEERSRSGSRSMGGSSGRGSSTGRGSSRGVSRGRARGSGPGGLPTPTSSRERMAKAAANPEGKPPETESASDTSIASEEADKEDEAVFTAELEKHGISGLDEGTRTAMLGLLRAKYGYRAGDLEPEL